MTSPISPVESVRPSDSTAQHDLPRGNFNTAITSRSDLNAVKNMENTSVKAPDSYGFPSSNSLLEANQAKPIQLAQNEAPHLEPPLVPQLDNSVPAEKPVTYQTTNFDGFEIHRYPNVSDAFLKNVEDQLQSMPEKEKDFLRKAGVKITACNLLSEADNEADKNPFDERGGEYTHSRNEILFSQRREQTEKFKGMKLGQMGAPVDNVSKHTFYHEWGHALDYNLQFSENKRTAFSDTPAFITPYLNELFDAIKHHRRDFQEMHYFVSDGAGSSNRTEMFAEMYTIARGKGDPKNHPSDKMIPKDFKNTYAKTESELDKRF